LHERRVKEEQELRDLEKKVAQATIDALEAQKKGKPTSLEQHAELAARRKEIKALQAQRTADPSGSTIRNSSNSRSHVLSLSHPPQSPRRPCVVLYVTLVLSFDTKTSKEILRDLFGCAVLMSGGGEYVVVEITCISSV